MKLAVRTLSKRHLWIGLSLILLLTIGSTRTAIAQQSLAVSISESHLTPGRVFSIDLQMELAPQQQLQFDASQLANWPFKILSVETKMPVWLQRKNSQNKGWSQHIQIQLAAPVSGHYQLPSLKLHLAGQGEVSTLKTAPMPFTVVSNFSAKQTPVLAPLATMPNSPTPRSGYQTTSFCLVVVSLFIFVVQRRRRKIKGKL